MLPAADRELQQRALLQRQRLVERVEHAVDVHRIRFLVSHACAAYPDGAG